MPGARTGPVVRANHVHSVADARQSERRPVPGAVADPSARSLRRRRGEVTVVLGRHDFRPLAMLALAILVAPTEAAERNIVEPGDGLAADPAGQPAMKCQIMPERRTSTRARFRDRCSLFWLRGGWWWASLVPPCPRAVALDSIVPSKRRPDHGSCGSPPRTVPIAVDIHCQQGRRERSSPAWSGTDLALAHQIALASSARRPGPRGQWPACHKR